MCIAEVESVEVVRVISLTGGRPPDRQPSWTTGDGLGITEYFASACTCDASADASAHKPYSHLQNDIF
jgi:hypothetical protein